MRQNLEKGAALITVLFMFFMAAIIATGIISRQRLDISRTMSFIRDIQAHQYTMGGEVYVRQILHRDAFPHNEVDHLDEDWATLKTAFDFEDGRIMITIEDLQKRLNINNLDKTKKVPDSHFNALLVAKEINTDYYNDLADWLDSNQETRLNEVEDAKYMNLDPPYRTANRTMTSISELRLIGLSKQEYDLLAPFVIALDEDALPINVNTASETILNAVITNRIHIEKILGKRAQLTPITGQDLTAMGLKNKTVSATSNYFRAHIRANFDGQTNHLASNIQRKKNDKGELTITTIGRDFGQTFKANK